MVTGAQPKEQLSRAEANVGEIGREHRALRLANLLVLRVVLAFDVFTLYYVNEVMPPHPQRALDLVLTRALRVAQCSPRPDVDPCGASYVRSALPPHLHVATVYPRIHPCHELPERHCSQEVHTLCLSLIV